MSNRSRDANRYKPTLHTPPLRIHCKVALFDPSSIYVAQPIREKRGYPSISAARTLVTHTRVDFLLGFESCRRSPREDILGEVGVSQSTGRHKADRERGLRGLVTLLQHSAHDLPDPQKHRVPQRYMRGCLQFLNQNSIST